MKDDPYFLSTTLLYMCVRNTTTTCAWIYKCTGFARCFWSNTEQSDLIWSGQTDRETGRRTNRLIGQQPSRQGTHNRTLHNYSRKSTSAGFIRAKVVGKLRRVERGICLYLSSMYLSFHPSAYLCFWLNIHHTYIGCCTLLLLSKCSTRSNSKTVTLV